MEKLLIYFLPSILSLKVSDKINKSDKKLNKENIIINYLKYTTIVNLVVYAILFVYTFGKENSISYSINDISFVFKYYVLAAIIAVILPIIEEFIKKHIEVSLEIKGNYEKNKKK